MAVYAGLAAPAVQAQAPDYSKVEFRSEKLADILFVLFGAGGNIAVLTGPDGAFVVDSDLTDERWGKGLFSPDAFVQRVYIELNRKPGPG